MCLKLHRLSSTFRTTSIALLTTAALSSSLLQADILASWDTWTDASGSNADETLTGFSATMTNSAGSNNIHGSFGSDDGTYGDDVSGASTSPGALLLSETSGSDLLEFTITNNSGQDFNIGTLHFDFAPRQNGNEVAHGYNTFVLSYVSGGLGPDSTEIDTQTGLSNVVLDGTDKAISAYPGYDYSLAASLTDTILSHGESAKFSIAFSGQTDETIGGNEGRNTSSILDNLAFQGAVIPEPSSLALLLLSGLGFLFLRRRS
ncbi:PEP-CTERM sorting domain-containing protein [Kiritimatiellota bacterium B12222]|nr:PEP-CTERM sorting domain-containing protein [Kiritimatiellota bacterium B12222]